MHAQICNVRSKMQSGNSLNKFPTIALYNLKIILMGGFIAQSYQFIFSTLY